MLEKAKTEWKSQIGKYDLLQSMKTKLTMIYKVRKRDA